MEITVFWQDAEHTIIYCHFPAQWTWDDFFAARSTLETMATSRTQPLTYILDAQESIHVPNYSFAAVQQLAKPPKRQIKRIIAVTPHLVHRRFYRLFLRMYPHMAHHLHLDFVDTLAEAEALIARRTLDQSS